LLPERKELIAVRRRHLPWLQAGVSKNTLGCRFWFKEGSYHMYFHCCHCQHIIWSYLNVMMLDSQNNMCILFECYLMHWYTYSRIDMYTILYWYYILYIYIHDHLHVNIGWYGCLCWELPESQNITAWVSRSVVLVTSEPETSRMKLWMPGSWRTSCTEEHFRYLS
jgi:hypothetical protein